MATSSADSQEKEMAFLGEEMDQLGMASYLEGVAVVLAVASSDAGVPAAAYQTSALDATLASGAEVGYQKM